MDVVEQKLHEMGLLLPPPPVAGGNYVPFRRNGTTLVLAGVICSQAGIVTHTGQVGREQTVESAVVAAQICALNTLAAIKSALGALTEVEEFIYLGGYVNAVAGFAESPQVINGASDLFVQLYGDAGRHARAAIAVAGLPRNATVEIQVSVKVKDQAGTKDC